MNEVIVKQKQWIFDRWAPTYDGLLPSVFYQAIHQRLLSYVQLPEQPNVLDLGCGTGRLLDRLATQFPTLQGTGLDLSPQMLQQARRRNRYHPRLIYLQGNAECLPFAEGQFDAVFNTISFLHYPQPEVVFAQVSRVLRAGGCFYLADYTAPTARSSLAKLRFSATGMHFYSSVAREQLGQSVGLMCQGHHSLLGPILLTRFLKS
jgi:ubiquinone/menaquinone biosynthesis C-methylase UbiE